MLGMSLWTGADVLMQEQKNPDKMSERELRLEVKDLRRAKKRLIREHRKGVEREKDLATLLKKYIRHIVDHEGIDYLENHHRTIYSGHEEFTDQQWRQLQALCKEALEEY